MDPSLTGFGISNGEIDSRFHTDSETGMLDDRVGWLVLKVRSFVVDAVRAARLSPGDDLLWAIEAPMLRVPVRDGNANGTHLYEIGYLMCALASMSRASYGFPVECIHVPTAALRKLVKLPGNAPKDSMSKAAFKALGIDIQVDRGLDKLMARLLHVYGTRVRGGEIVHADPAQRGSGKRRARGVA
jgi:hypothetical protein